MWVVSGKVYDVVDAAEGFDGLFYSVAGLFLFADIGLNECGVNVVDRFGELLCLCCAGAVCDCYVDAVFSEAVCDDLSDTFCTDNQCHLWSGGLVGVWHVQVMAEGTGFEPAVTVR